MAWRTSVDDVIGARFGDLTELLKFLARVPKLVGHHDGCHQEEPVILYGLRPAPDPLHMRVDFSGELLNPGLFSVPAPHPETTPIYDYCDLGHRPALLRQQHVQQAPTRRIGVMDTHCVETAARGPHRGRSLPHRQG